MKKVLVMMLALCMVLTGCGSSTPEVTTTEAPSGPMTFEQLQEKYKRKSWDEFIADPLGFVRDFRNSMELSKEEWTQDWSVFEFVDDKTLPYYEGNVVFFNQPFEVHVWERGYAPGLNGIMIVGGTDIDLLFDSFKQIFETGIQELGDPKELINHYDTVSEADFRKALDGPFEFLDSYSASWSSDLFHFKVTITNFKDHATLQLL